MLSAIHKHGKTLCSHHTPQIVLQVDRSGVTDLKVYWVLHAHPLP